MSKKAIGEPGITEVTALLNLINSSEDVRRKLLSGKTTSEIDFESVRLVDKTIIDATWSLHTMKRELNMDADDKAKAEALSKRDERYI